jgi:DNA mismatch repair protein MutL
MKGRYPVAILFLEMDAAGVDVNIHPAKREVRFHDDFTIRHFVVKAVTEALRDVSGAPAARFTFPSPDLTAVHDRRSNPPSDPVEKKDTDGHRPPLHQELPPAVETPIDSPIVDPAPVSTDPVLPLELEPPVSPLRPAPLITNRLGLRVLGCMANLYIIAESPEGLVLIDQHAAHERVLFEQMLRRMALQNPASQQLLFPVTLDFLPREADFVLAQVEPLQQAGVGITRFGPSSFLVDALPAMVKTRDVAEFIRTIVTDLQQEGGETRKGRRLSEEVVAKTVCRHAVKANDALKPEEWDNLLHDLLACDLPYTCPHGRPTMIQLSAAELDKKFGRMA